LQLGEVFGRDASYEYVTDLICALEVGVGIISGTAADRESRDSIGPLGISNQDDIVRAKGDVVVGRLDVVFDRGGSSTGRTGRGGCHVHIRALLAFPQHKVVNRVQEVGICIVAMDKQVSGRRPGKHLITVVVKIEDRRFVDFLKSEGIVAEFASQLVQPGFLGERDPQIDGLVYR